MTLKVWSDNAPAGLLDREGQRGSTLTYLPMAEEARAVSLTMPVRLQLFPILLLFVLASF